MANPNAGRGPNVKCWAFTCYDLDLDLRHFPEIEVKYVILGKEVCPETQRKHIQGFVWFTKCHRFGAVKTFFQAFPTMHIEACKGSPYENFVYCSKEGDFVERGILDDCYY